MWEKQGIELATPATLLGRLEDEFDRSLEIIHHLT